MKWRALKIRLILTPQGCVSFMVESLKICFVSIFAAILYGVVHDQITARVCLEYFTVFHPPVFVTQSPTLLAFGWGVIATWWMGAFLGLLLAIAARGGTRPKLSAVNLLKPIAKLLGMMAGCALLAGFLGFVLTRQNLVSPPQWVSHRLPPVAYARFMADWWAHSASYAVGFFGGIILCVLLYRNRAKDESLSPVSGAAQSRVAPMRD
jgi:hypothetical protein